jgi:hypothetical protein
VLLDITIFVHSIIHGAFKDFSNFSKPLFYVYVTSSENLHNIV